MLTSGKKLDGRYVVREEIGSGGFGAVYRAIDTRFGGNNQVAIKKIVQSSEQAAKAFRNEADLLYNLSHPNLPRVTDCFQEDGANFIVMEYISGDDLLKSLKSGKRFAVTEVLEIADTVLDALEYLHSFLIFHRDVKPDNIKINENGKIYLLDFGTAKGNFDETTVTRVSRSVTGFTPFYAPLEQILRADASSFLFLKSLEPTQLENFLDRKTDARSDIYSLGATAYHLLTGHFPEKAMATTRAYSVWSGKPDTLPSCRDLNSEIPLGLAQIVHRCLEIEPEKRFQSATELRAALKNLSSAAEINEIVSAPLTQMPSALSFASENAPSHTVAFPNASRRSTLEKTALLQSPETESQIFPPAASTPPNFVAEGEPVLATIESFFVAGENQENVKPKSKMPIYLGLFILLAILGVSGGWLAWRNLAGTSLPPDAHSTGTTSSGRILNYSLLVQKMRDGKKFQEPFESSGREIFESGYQFQVRLVPPADGYLYAFAEGLDKNGAKIFTIQFPTPKKNSGSAEVVALQNYETGWNEFAGSAGTENFWIVWSKDKPEIAEKGRENAFQNAGVIADNNLSGKLKDYLESLAGKNKTNAAKDTDKRITKVDFEGDSLAYLIQLEHR